MSLLEENLYIKKTYILIQKKTYIKRLIIAKILVVPALMIQYISY